MGYGLDDIKVKNAGDENNNFPVQKPTTNSTEDTLKNEKNSPVEKNASSNSDFYESDSSFGSLDIPMISDDDESPRF